MRYRIRDIDVGDVVTVEEAYGEHTLRHKTTGRVLEVLPARRQIIIELKSPIMEKARYDVDSVLEVKKFRRAVDDGLAEPIPVQQVETNLFVTQQKPERGQKWLVEAAERVARAVMAAMPVENSLNGMTNIQARRNVNQLLEHYTKGLFRDDNWEAVDRIWKAMTAGQLDWTMTGAEYYHVDKGMPRGKIWKFEVRFVNKNGRPTTLHGMVTAAGAGSVDDPLDRYDLTAYV